MKNLIAILGPTASGKTSLSVKLAKHFNTEIISCDSRQFFKEMSIGTAKATAEEMDGVPHHFIGHISIEQEYSAGKFETDALKTIESIHEQNKYCILTGGSGLYSNAVLFGLEDIPGDAKIREEWNAVFKENGIVPLQEKLKELDPEYFQQVDQNNHMRLIRAIEVILSSGKKYSSQRTGIRKKRPFNTISIGLDVDRNDLYDRINQRVDNMIKAGLEQEARTLFKYRDLNALQTVGYNEMFDYFDGKLTYSEAIERIKRSTRHYAKRQMTWLRRQEDIHWFQPNDLKEIIECIESAHSDPSVD